MGDRLEEVKVDTLSKTLPEVEAKELVKELD